MPGKKVKKDESKDRDKPKFFKSKEHERQWIKAARQKKPEKKD
jgi:hypothetical protein